MTQIILYGLIFFTYYYFIFSATGSILTDVLKLQTKNIYFGLLMGMFFYFTTMSMLMIPLEFISRLKYIVLVYYFISVNILYVLILIIFIRFWFATNIFDWNHLLFLIVFVAFVFLGYYKSKFINVLDGTWKDDFRVNVFSFEKKDNIPTFEIKDNLGIGDVPQYSSHAWYTNIAVWFIITRMDPTKIIDNYISLYDSFIFAALFVTLYTYFAKKNNNNFITAIISFLVLISSRIILYYFGYDAAHPQNMLTNLFIVIFVIIGLYTIQEYRSRNFPWVIGIIFASYPMFDWKSSYVMLYLIYVASWISLIHFKSNFIIDFIKFTIFSSVCFIVYNINEQSVFQALLFTGLLVFLIFTSIFLVRNYARVQEFEIKMYNRRKSYVVLLPIIFVLGSVVLALATNEFNFNFWTIQNIAEPLYIKLNLARWYDKINIIFLWFTLVLLLISIIWLFVYDSVSEFRAKTQLTMISLLIVTFFNPFSGKMLLWVSNNKASLNNISVFISALLVMLNISVYDLKVKKFTFRKEKRNGNVLYL